MDSWKTELIRLELEIEQVVDSFLAAADSVLPSRLSSVAYWDMLTPNPNWNGPEYPHVTVEQWTTLEAKHDTNQGMDRITGEGWGTRKRLIFL